MSIGPAYTAETRERFAVDLAKAGAANDAKPALPRRGWSPREVAEQLGIKYKTALGLIRSGELAALQVGQHYIVPDHELERLLQSVRKESAP